MHLPPNTSSESAYNSQEVADIKIYSKYWNKTPLYDTFSDLGKQAYHDLVYIYLNR